MYLPGSISTLTGGGAELDLRAVVGPVGWYGGAALVVWLPAVSAVFPVGLVALSCVGFAISAPSFG